MENSEKDQGVCTVDGCRSPKQTRGWCPKHYKRWRVSGSPTFVKNSEYVIGGTNEERFWPKVQITGFCWNWTGAMAERKQDGRGYGVFNLKAPTGYRAIPAQRFSYETLVGPVPEGLELDRLCRNRKCVNPDHLKPSTRGEIIRRARALQQGRPLEPSLAA